MLHLNIVIVGAGIAGLSTAIALQRKGHTITVLERHPSCQALGAPVGLSANATRVLIHYGMEEIMTKTDAMLQHPICQRRYDNGKILGSRGVGQSLKDYGFPSWALSRYRLQEILAKVAGEKGVKILFGKHVVGVDLEKRAVTLRDGEVMEADLIIGADGIRSIIRDAVQGSTPVKTNSPFSAYNIDIPRSLLKGDPSLSHLLEEANFWLGPSKIIVGLNMPDMGDKYNMCLVSEEEAGKEGEWYELGDLRKVKEKFADFEPAIQKLLEIAQPADCYIWRFSEMPPLENWVSGNGKGVIVGDAGHAMLPYTGMGASQCIEDSACLALCLEKAAALSDLPEVLKAYEAIRKPRTEWLVKRGRENAELWHLHDGPEQERRDQFLGSLSQGPAKMWDGKPIDDPPEGRFNPLAFVYMSSFDVMDYTRRRLEEILG